VLACLAFVAGDVMAACNAPDGTEVELDYSIDPSRDVFAIGESATMTLLVDAVPYATETLDTSGVSTTENDKHHKLTYADGKEDSPGDCSITFDYTVVKVESVTADSSRCFDGQQISFTAIPLPSGTDFPSGCPIWSASAGSFPGGNVGPSVVWQAPSGSGAAATITATCGSSSACNAVTYVHIDREGGGGSLLRQARDAFTFVVEPAGTDVSISALSVPPSLAVTINDLAVEVDNILDDTIYAYIDNVASVEFEASLPGTEWLKNIGIDWDLKKEFRKIRQLQEATNFRSVGCDCE